MFCELVTGRDGARGWPLGRGGLSCIPNHNNKLALSFYLCSLSYLQQQLAPGTGSDSVGQVRGWTLVEAVLRLRGRQYLDVNLHGAFLRLRPRQRVLFLHVSWVAWIASFKSRKWDFALFDFPSYRLCFWTYLPHGMGIVLISRVNNII